MAMTTWQDDYDALARAHQEMDEALEVTPPCEHRAYRYQMDGCRWCELHRDLDRTERAMDRMITHRPVGVAV